MKVLVNASTLIVGGGIQVGVSFIQLAIKNEDFDWLFVVSLGIYNNLSLDLQNDERIICIKTPPSKIFSGKESRKIIKNITRSFQPDLIYSPGFPSYIRFKETEIGRYTNGWEVNAKPLPWHTIKGFSTVLKIKLAIYYRILWARRADYIETQTEAAKRGISKRAFFPIDKIKVIPNSPNQIFITNGQDVENGEVFNRKQIAFCLSAPYTHKNLDIIPYVAQELRSKFNVDLVFILTLPSDSNIWLEIEEKAKELKVEDLIQNVGILKLDECIAYYKLAKIVFLPTLLEIFSATYLEAMAMKVPIVTTDLEFAKDNCKDAAQFFKPGDPKDAAVKINDLLTNKELFINQIDTGLRVLNSYPSLDQKFNDLFDWFKLIIKNKK
jgi:glycosyltransferase involved in cell wall biosynthesis